MMSVPSLKRRFAALVYEGVVLFGVTMAAGLVFALLADQRHALSWRGGLQLFLLAVLGLYFVWFWTHGGQTVAMKAWHIRVVGPDGTPPSTGRALGRYLLSWLWFAPSLLVIGLNGWHESGPIWTALGIGMLAYVLLTLALPGRQFLHDRLAGTRLEPHRPAPRPARPPR